jgi:hypothetical protein
MRFPVTLCPLQAVAPRVFVHLDHAVFPDGCSEVHYLIGPGPLVGRAYLSGALVYP